MSMNFQSLSLLDWSLRGMMETSRASSSDSPFTSSSAAAEEEELDWVSSWEYGGESMVGSELEAAEALAGLAHSAMLMSGTRTTHRVKTESPPANSRSNPEDAALRSSYSSEDQAEVVKQQGEGSCNLKMEGMVEQDAEFPKPSHMNTSSYVPCAGSKSRKLLTGAEKEARRIQRVLANRESARQTIRRRQALYEELTRKASDLACENENLKREKELALEDFESLKSTNDCLKAQMAKTVKTDIEETQVYSNPANAMIPTSAFANCPFFIFNQPPFSPFPLAHIQSSNPMQLQNLSQNAIFVPSDISMPSIAKPDLFCEQENPMKVNGQGTQLYIMPCPWFFPIPDHGSGHNLGPSLDLNDEQNGNSTNNPCSAGSSSKIIAPGEKNPLKSKPEASSKKDEGGAAKGAEARRKRKEVIKLKGLHRR